MVKYKTIIFVFLALALTFFSFRSLLRPGYFPMHDDMQAMRVLQMDKCVRDFQIPCRWVPDMGYSFGYPQFNYYSPLPYYLMEGIHLLGFSFLDSVKGGFILGFLLSSFFMFLLGKSLWGNWGGVVASVFYTYAPYRAMDVYNRGAMGEFWALVFFPAVFWAILEFIKKEREVFLIFLALSIGGLLLSHNISTMIFLPFVLGWTLLLLTLEKKWRMFPKIILGGLLGLGLAGFFVLPAVVEKQFAHTETMLMGYFNYLAHFLSLGQLFFSSHWGYSSSILGPNDDVSFAIGNLHWLLALLFLVISFFQKNRKIFILGLFLFVSGLFSAFLTHSKSTFIWQNIFLLEYLQFPWRFLALAIFFSSILAAGLAKNKFTAIFLVVLVIFFNLSFFRPSNWYDISDSDKFSGQLWEKQLTISIFDYLPIFAKMPPDKKAPEEALVLSGEAIIKNYQKGTNWQKGEIVVLQKAQIRLPIFYFPGMELTVDGKKTDFSYMNFLGLPTFDLEKGEHQVVIRLTDTPIRKAGNLLTILSILGLLGIVVKIKRNEKA